LTALFEHAGRGRRELRSVHHPLVIVAFHGLSDGLQISRMRGSVIGLYIFCAVTLYNSLRIIRTSRTSLQENMYLGKKPQYYSDPLHPPPCYERAPPAGTLPPPSHNGGLFTGEPFLPGAPWRNFPAVPDSYYLIHHNLRSADPPLDALYQYPGGNTRPGNNHTYFKGISSFTPVHRDVHCAPSLPRDPQRTGAQGRQNRFSKHYYLVHHK